jgi:hypothetical protein
MLAAKPGATAGGFAGEPGAGAAPPRALVRDRSDTLQPSRYALPRAFGSALLTALLVLIMQVDCMVVKRVIPIKSAFAFSCRHALRTISVRPQLEMGRDAGGLIVIKKSSGARE